VRNIQQLETRIGLMDVVIYAVVYVVTLYLYHLTLWIDEGI
jgi:hypothetical protein